MGTGVAPARGLLHVLRLREPASRCGFAGAGGRAPWSAGNSPLQAHCPAARLAGAPDGHPGHSKCFFLTPEMMPVSKHRNLCCALSPTLVIGPFFNELTFPMLLTGLRTFSYVVHLEQ